MRTGIVIPAGAGREANLRYVLACVHRLETKPAAMTIVYDGCDPYVPEYLAEFPVLQAALPKHEPGMEQPRNVGLRLLEAASAKLKMEPLTHVWFLDTDVIVEPDCLTEIEAAYERGDEDRIMCCPYDWMGPGQRAPEHTLINDPRWPSFQSYGPEDALTEDLAAGLACFSGNLVWPIEAFKRVGGFWSELHHGRCEDGELGLRAVAMGVPISFASLARGWHLWHETNPELTMARNARDVPMLNARHPWVQEGGVLVVEEDGKRFDVQCSNCGQQLNTGEWWHHASACSGEFGIPVTAPPKEIHLP